MVGESGNVFIFVSGMVGGLLLVGLCVWGLIGLYLMRDITLVECMLYGGLLVGLAIIAPLGGGPIGAMGPLIVFPLAIGFPLMRRWGNARALAKIEQGDIDKYKATIAKRPELPYPYKKLGEICRNRGYYTEAIEWYRKYQSMAYEPELEQRIKRCVELLEKAQQRIKICADCRHENTADARYCVGCGATLPGWWELIAPFRGKAGKNYLLTVAIVSLVVGVVLGFLTTMNMIYAMLCLWIGAAAFVYYMYKRVTAY